MKQVTTGFVFALPTGVFLRIWERGSGTKKVVDIEVTDKLEYATVFSGLPHRLEIEAEKQYPGCRKIPVKVTREIEITAFGMEGGASL